MKFKLLILTLTCGITTYVYAEQATLADSTSTPAAEQKKVADAAKSTKFSIPEGAELDVTLLNKCWENRENKENQKIIADHLMSKPAIAGDYEAAWKTARLVYFIGNFGYGEEKFVKTSEGVKLFDYGVKAGKLAYELNPKGVEGYYWYAVDLGSYGLAKGILSAASNAKDGMKALENAKKINPKFEEYGSSRILGRYYHELPKIGFGGDSEKALQLIKEARDKAPNSKANAVYLGKYYLKEGQYAEALKECDAALKLNMNGKFENMRYTKEAQECKKKAQEELS